VVAGPVVDLAAGQRHNLPDGLSSFVGRDREIAEVAELVERSRLVTLVGASGVGKTRLALGVATSILNRFPGGAWLVELAPLADAGLLHRAVASALDLQEQPGRPLLATVAEALEPQRTLLLLDNCEHLVLGCAELAAQLLRRCKNLSILATSRELLGVTGELTLRVPSLRVPQPPPPPLETLTQYEAVRLFVDRAVAVQPDFRVTNQNAPAVAELCWRVDGIALAIELAAAWVRVLSPEQILARLNDAFHLLVGGSRIAPARQQTLRAAIEWSYGLLEAAERRLFQRLAVFAGGWTIEAAEAVCVDEALPSEDVLGVLARLVDKSLVVAEPQAESGEVRYRLLELLRAYSWEQAQAAGETSRLQRRHRDWFLALVERVPPAMLDAEHIATLERERDNLRAALRWTIDSGEHDVGFRLATAAWPMWYVRGYYSEGRAWLAELLDLPGGTTPTPARARALAVAGHLVYCQAEYVAAEALLRQALSMAAEVGDEQTHAIVLQFQANMARAEGDAQRALELYAAARELNRQLGSPVWEAMSLIGQGQAAADQGDHVAAEQFATQSLALCCQAGHVWGAARALWTLGRVASSSGDFARAHRLLQECMTLQRRIGDRQGLVWACVVLAHSAAQAGELPLAADSIAEALRMAREVGDRLSITRAIDEVGGLVAAMDPSLAVRLLAATQAARAALGANAISADRGGLETTLAEARRALGESHYAEVWEWGSALTLEQVLEEGLEALATARARAAAVARPEPGTSVLTRREREVAQLLAQGLTDRQIAELLVITEGTAGVHVAHILAKLEFHSRAQIAAWVIEHALH
jgi:non-specific serine/threonine protein kinase